MFSKLTIKTQNDASGVILVSLLLTLNNFTPCSSVSTVNVEHLAAAWVRSRGRTLVGMSYL